MTASVTETLVGSSDTLKKSTCRKCNRTIIVVMVPSSFGPGLVQVETDPAGISAVPLEGPRKVIQARPVHSARCEEYQREAERARLATERRAWDAKQRKLKKAPSGRREPGQ